MSIKSRIETPATTPIKSGTQTPEGHDRNYHLKKADGSSDHHIPLIKSLLARPDVTLHEALVYGILLDKLGQGHTYCCPTQRTLASTLRISKKSVVRAMAKLKEGTGRDRVRWRQEPVFPARSTPGIGED